MDVGVSGETWVPPSLGQALGQSSLSGLWALQQEEAVTVVARVT